MLQTYINNDSICFSLAKDHVIDSVLRVYGVAAVPDEPTEHDEDDEVGEEEENTGHLVTIMEAGMYTEPQQ